MTYHRMTIDLIITPTLLKKEIYTIFGKSLRLPMKNQIPQDFGKSQGNDSVAKRQKKGKEGEAETPPRSLIPLFKESLVLLGSHRDDKSVEFGSTDKDKIFFHIRIWLRLGFS